MHPYDWSEAAPWLAGVQAQPPAIQSVQGLDLGAVHCVPLSLTDGAPLHGGGWLLSAVAEDTSDSVADGACVASALGVVAADSQVRSLVRLQGASKVEGIAVQTDGASAAHLALQNYKRVAHNSMAMLPEAHLTCCWPP